jgi:hypothetical protein
MVAMPIPRENLMRLLPEIDQQLGDLRDILETPEIESQFDQRTTDIYRMVCLEVARAIAEDHLKYPDGVGADGKELPSWDALTALCRLSKNWPDG